MRLFALALVSLALRAAVAAPLRHLQEEEEQEQQQQPLISNAWKYESLKWSQRSLIGNSSLALDVLDDALLAASEELCGQGITVTVFDETATEVYQNTVGSTYNDFSGYLNHSATMEGWTGDTTMALYSNSKILTVATFFAAVVDTGLGFVDEPIATTFPESDDRVGMVTPRMLASHSSGMARYNRADARDPYYTCIYDESTTFSDCLDKFLLKDDTLEYAPGAVASYRNEPFDVLAELIVRKTGLDNFGEAFRQYIAEPIGMENTSIDCPGVRSTSEKPHGAWGYCSTAHDMAKLMQVLSNQGMTPDGEDRILSTYSIQQMFSSGIGQAVNRIFNTNFPMTRCYTRLDDPQDFSVSSIIGYGLGTFFFPGNKGDWFVHLGTSGGWWLVAPGRYSAYIGWMHDPRGFGGTYAYSVVSKMLDAFEEASTFMVANTGVFEGLGSWEEIETCGGGVLFDYFNLTGVSTLPVTGPCESSGSSVQKMGTKPKTGPQWLVGLAENLQEL